MCRVVLCTPAAVLPVHYQFKGKDDMTGFSRSQLMQLTIAALPRGSDVMWCVPEDVMPGQHELPGQHLLASPHSARVPA